MVEDVAEAVEFVLFLAQSETTLPLIHSVRRVSAAVDGKAARQK